MKRYKVSKKYGRKKRNWLFIFLAVLALLVIGVGVVRVTYTNNLKPLSSSSTTSYFTVPSGASVKQIAASLKDSGLIRSSTVFENYVRSNEFHDQLQAGTYVLSPSMSVQQIVKKMISGDVAKNLLTILPGKRIDQIEQVFTANGYSQDQIDTAFNPATYAGDAALVSLPSGASLEGYLYPDSFQKTADTPASTIVKESLDEMEQHLTPDIIKGFNAQGLSTYQGITLASIVYQETDDSSSQPTVAQVFLSRIKQGMMLQSNVTANYAADIAGVARDVSINSPYNTYLHTGLPPGPIDNVTVQALNAVAHPANTDYLYFIAGDDGKMHFSHTEAEHEQAIIQYCQTECAQP